MKFDILSPVQPQDPPSYGGYDDHVMIRTTRASEDYKTPPLVKIAGKVGALELENVGACIGIVAVLIKELLTELILPIHILEMVLQYVVEHDYVDAVSKKVMIVMLLQ